MDALYAWLMDIVLDFVALMKFMTMRRIRAWPARKSVSSSAGARTAATFALIGLAQLAKDLTTGPVWSVKQDTRSAMGSVRGARVEGFMTVSRRLVRPVQGFVRPAKGRISA